MSILAELTLSDDLIHKTDSDKPSKKKGEVIFAKFKIGEFREFLDGNFHFRHYIEPGIFARLDIKWFSHIKISNSGLHKEIFGTPDEVRDELDYILDFYFPKE